MPSPELMGTITGLKILQIRELTNHIFCVCLTITKWQNILTTKYANFTKNGSHFNSYVAAKNRIDEVFWITNLTLIFHDLEKIFNLKVSWIILSKWNYQVYCTLACYKNPITSFSNEVIPKLEVSRYLCYASVRLISATERCAQIKRMNLVSNTFILQFFLYHFKLFVLMHTWKNRSNQVTKDDH